jgi:hypothetical protein
MRFTRLQLIQLVAYVDACISLDRFIQRCNELPCNEGHDRRYWAARADLEEDKRDKFAALESSLTWGAE